MKSGWPLVFHHLIKKVFSSLPVFTFGLIEIYAQKISSLKQTSRILMNKTIIGRIRE